MESLGLFMVVFVQLSHAIPLLQIKARGAIQMRNLVWPASMEGNLKISYCDTEEYTSAAMLNKEKMF